MVRSSEVCHPVREDAELPVRIPKLRVAGSNPVSRSNPSCGPVQHELVVVGVHGYIASTRRRQGRSPPALACL